MSRIPIRLRLTILSALVIAAVLFLAAWLVYARVGSDLTRALDQDLRGRAQDLSALVEHRGSLQTTTGALIESGESFAELVDGTGRVVDSTRPIGTKLLVGRLELARAHREPVFANRPSVPGLDEPARLLAVPVPPRGPGFVLIVGATRENRAETLGSLRRAFLIGGPLALLVVSLGGYLLAVAALRPIEAMRRRAEEISTSSIGERLPVSPARDEVARLGETLNEMLARLEDGLERQRRFVADASHELRTPLALLRTELELALRRARSVEELEQTIRSAAAETNRLARIAEDLLLLARSEQGRLPLQRVPVDVAEVLATVAARFSPRAEQEARTISVARGATPVVRADRLRLEQALGNLVDNALRHGAGKVVLSAAAHNSSVEMHVRDDGAGFPDPFLERAFERFSRADEARGAGGTGLGLAIVDTVARAHEGSARAANSKDGGADVWIALPADG